MNNTCSPKTDQQDQGNDSTKDAIWETKSYWAQGFKCSWSWKSKHTGLTSTSWQGWYNTGEQLIPWHPGSRKRESGRVWTKYPFQVMAMLPGSGSMAPPPSQFSYRLNATAHDKFSGLIIQLSFHCTPCWGPSLQPRAFWMAHFKTKPQPGRGQAHVEICKYNSVIF